MREFDQVILGENAIFTTDSEKTGLNNNIIVCGASGSGKTMSVAEPRLLETFNSSLIVTVTKRKLVEKYTPVFERRGYKVLDLNFAEPLKSTVSFDPLKYISSYEDITFLATTIVNATSRRAKSNADPYWDQAATSLLCAYIALVLMKYGREASFDKVLALHHSMSFDGDRSEINTSIDMEFKKVAQADPDCLAMRCWRTFKQLPRGTAGCVFSTLNTTIDTIFSPDISRMIAKNKTVDFRAISNQKTVLFISSSPMNLALNSFINMCYATGFKELFKYAEKLPEGKLPIPVHMLCDDFATGGRIANFPDYISVFREKRISAEILIQSESQLESMYGKDDAITITNNCDSYIYLGGNDLTTGRNLSERLNVPLEDVLYMPVGQVYVFRRGSRPIITKRYDILKDAVYQKVTMEYEEKEANKAR